MNFICNDCGKQFKFKSKYIEHKARKTPCIIKPIENSKKGTVDSKKGIVDSKKGIVDSKKGTVDSKKGIVDSKKGIVETMCKKCNNVFTKYYLETHEKNCKGNKLQCKTCLKVFDTCRSRAVHERLITCSPVNANKSISQVPQQITKNYVINNYITNHNNNNVDNRVHQTNNIDMSCNNTNNILNNMSNTNIKITYNEDTGYLETNDPNAPNKSMMCYNTFKYACANKDDQLPQINNKKLLEISKDILSNKVKNYDTFWNFLFRNMDNKSMHMFMLSRNNNATHAKYFNKGDIQSIHKVVLYKTLASYVSHYILLQIDFEIGASIVSLLSDDPNSKNSFFHVIKENSETFKYFKNWINDDNDNMIMEGSQSENIAKIEN